MQALAKDLPWRVKEARVVEILEAVSVEIIWGGGDGMILGLFDF